MPFGPFERDILSEKIAAKLLSLIKEKELRPGDKLPPERELATKMKVSRPSLREALRALSIMKVVEIRHGDGTYISSLSPQMLVEHLDFVFTLDDSTFLELFETRKIIEVGIVALAAQRITDEEIAALEVCVTRSSEATHDPKALLQLDLDIHSQIAQAARNHMLIGFMQVINSLGLASRQRTVQLPGVPERSIGDHQRIVAALKARNPEAARQAMLDHLANVQQELKRMTLVEANPLPISETLH